MEREEKSKLEKISGNFPVSLSVAALGAMGGNPLAALLPMLTGSLAHGRHSRRIEKTLDDIVQELGRQQEILDNITDQQYKLLSEIISTVYRTVDGEKLNYLKQAVVNCLAHEEMSHDETQLISRVISDICVDEAKFIVSRALEEKKFSRMILLQDDTDQPQSERKGNTVSLTISLRNPRRKYVSEDTLYLDADNDSSFGVMFFNDISPC